MKTIIESINVYTIDELSEKAKNTAWEHWQETNLDYDWWQFVYDDFTTIMGLFGCEIDNIYFSGFWSQGDGACFFGNYSYKPGWKKAVKDYCPNETNMLKHMQAIADIMRKYFYRPSVSITQRGYHYSHSGTMNVDSDDIMTDDMEIVQDNFRWIADELYSKLEKEYEYLQSMEQFIESCHANDYQFTEDGEFYA